MSEENTTKPKRTRTISIASNKPEGKVHSITLSGTAFWGLLLLACTLVGVFFGILISPCIIKISTKTDSLFNYSFLIFIIIGINKNIITIYGQYIIFSMQFEFNPCINGSINISYVNCFVIKKNRKCIVLVT